MAGNLEKHTPTKKIEQLVLERPIKLYKESSYALVDNVKIFTANEWEDVFNSYHKYNAADIRIMLNQGYKVASISKAFAGGDESGLFGVETMILEKETIE